MLPRLRDLFKPRAKSRAPSWEQLFEQAQALQQQGKLEEAVRLYGLVIDGIPNWAQAYYKRANALNGLGRPDAALEDYDLALSLDPSYAYAWCNRGSVLEGLGRRQEALESYERALALDPHDAMTHYNRGSVLKDLKRLEESLTSYAAAIALNPDYAEAYVNQGNVLQKLQQHAAAVESFGRAIELRPIFAEAFQGRGLSQHALQHFEEAIGSYDAAIALNREYADAYVNRGNVLQQLRRHSAAVESFGRAIELNPLFAEAFQGRGLSWYFLRRVGDALTDYNRAIALKPDMPAAYHYRGHLFSELNLYHDAVRDLTKAAELNPDAENFQSLAAALVRLKQFDLAITNYDKATALDPGSAYLIGSSRLAKMHACHWDGLEADLDLIAEGIRAGNPVCEPMPFAAMLDSPALQRSVAEIWVRDRVSHVLGPQGQPRPLTGGLPEHSPVFSAGKIRIGYFSADFRTHPVALLTAGVFEHHDRSKFEVTAFAFGPETSDAMQVRLAKAFDRLVDVRQQSNPGVAALARELGIDIAVDLNGFTEHSRTEIFALRAAPIQINFLGYPGTLGAQFMDYLIADRIVIPRAQQAHYAEQIVYLPNSFMPFDSNTVISDKIFTREELGLPPTGFVFCCFSNNYKIMPEIFNRWMSILSRVEDSVLWLSQVNVMAIRNLRTEAERRGVAGGRLIFANRMISLPEHLARLKVADLFLDTYPYNAHATAMDALWAGVPLLTYAGQSFASRVAASLLCTAGLPEFVAGSAEQYEEKAVELAKHSTGIRQARRKLSLRDTALFDTVLYTRNIEAAYEAIYERFRSGLPPTHINEHLNG
jgi:predicted O-linked N-acetylglucosamine transferase (SPINDLY family)